MVVSSPYPADAVEPMFRLVKVRATSPRYHFLTLQFSGYRTLPYDAVKEHQELLEAMHSALIAEMVMGSFGDSYGPWEPEGQLPDWLLYEEVSDAG